MKARILRACHKLHRTYRAGGLTEGLHQLAREVLATLYHREAQYIFVRRVEAHAALPPPTDAAERMGTTCLFVESAEALQEVAVEIPLLIRDSVDQLKQRLAQGCVVVLARRLKPSGTGQEVIGYGIYEPGVFSALGRKGKVSSDILFNHYVEVLPEYRGRRVANLMDRIMETYCVAHGFRTRCTVVSIHTPAPLKSSLRAGLTIVGTIARVSVLRGLVVWETPWERIEKALQVVDHAERPSSGS